MIFRVHWRNAAGSDRKRFPCTIMEKIGRHDIEADRANDVAPGKTAPPSGGIFFLGAN